MTLDRVQSGIPAVWLADVRIVDGRVNEIGAIAPRAGGRVVEARGLPASWTRTGTKKGVREHFRLKRADS